MRRSFRDGPFALPAHFRGRKWLISQGRCPGFLRSPRHVYGSTTGVRFPVCLFAEERAAVPVDKRVATVHALTRSRVLPGFFPLGEESAVPTNSRAEHFGPAHNRVAPTLIQELATAVAFLSDPETLRTDVSGFDHG